MKLCTITTSLCLALASPVIAEDTPRAGQLAMELVAVDQVIMERSAKVLEYASGAAELQVMLDGNNAICSGTERGEAFDVALLGVIQGLVDIDWVGVAQIRQNLLNSVETKPEIRAAAVLCSKGEVIAARQNIAAMSWELARRANVIASSLTDYRTKLEQDMVAAALEHS